MQPFLGFVLQLVGNSAISFLSCISISCVAIEGAMATIIALVAFERQYSNV